MERLRVTPRPDYAARVEAQGLSFHAREGYWTEDACYRLTPGEVDTLEAATAELHGLYSEALDRVIDQGRLGELAVPELFHDALSASWKSGSPSVYGRFDLAYDGHSPPKLLEYNADTPTSLLESAVIQWTWREEMYPSADQFNSIHERLIAAWSKLPPRSAVSVACLTDQEEDWVCSAYLLDTLVQSGRGGAVIDLADMGWDPVGRVFVDELSHPIPQLFKLYPWEWLMREEFGPHLLACETMFIEPMYKAALSSKGMLSILWEYFPGHPNLLASYRSSDQLVSYARKPLLSREGHNVTLVRGGVTIAECDGTYGEEGYVYQQLCPLPTFDHRHAMIGSWVIDGEPAGIGIRESQGLITTDQSCFVPHWF